MKKTIIITASLAITLTLAGVMFNMSRSSKNEIEDEILLIELENAKNDSITKSQNQVDSTSVVSQPDTTKKESNIGDDILEAAQKSVK